MSEPIILRDLLAPPLPVTIRKLTPEQARTARAVNWAQIMRPTPKKDTK